jgi:putative heme-binding domain-containing protein
MNLPAFLLALLMAGQALRAAEPDAADKRLVQTVQRMASFDYEKANEKTKGAIGRYLAATAGSAEYFQLVEKFRVKAERDRLLGLAVGQAGTPVAGQAAKLLFDLGEGASVVAAMKQQPEESAAKLVETVAALGSPEASAVALAVVADPAVALGVRRAAVAGLGRHPDGQRKLLDSARAGSVEAGLRDAVASVLATSTDEAVRREAESVIPMQAAAKLPPVAELAKRSGDAGKGQTVYMTYCFTCHQVNGLGVDFGPALSEIGSKLAKEALYDAILNPSAGISFGYEGWEVKMKDGTTWVGMVASETDGELVLRVPGGVLQKCPKGEVVSRSKLTASLMTPNLHTVIAEPDLVDLVEYLTSLKKKP